MSIFRLSKAQQYAAFASTVVGLIVTVYQFIPEIKSIADPLKYQEVHQLFKEHESFVRNGNVEGMLSRYHPDFSMDTVHSTLYTESFDLSQIQKHLADIQRIKDFKIGESDVKIKMINDSMALISVQMTQQYKAGFVTVNEQLFQSMVVINHWGQPKILKVISVAKKNNSDFPLTQVDTMQ